MTEFVLSEDCCLGIMPAVDIKRILGDSLPEPSLAQGIPRAEIYPLVDDPVVYHKRALDAGAIELSSLQNADGEMLQPTL